MKKRTVQKHCALFFVLGCSGVSYDLYMVDLIFV